MTLPGPLDPGSLDLHKIVLATLQSSGLNAELFQLIRRAYSAALSEQGIVLSRAESDRLSARVTRSVLEDLLSPGSPPA